MNRLSQQEILDFFHRPTTMFETFPNAATEKNARGTFFAGELLNLPKPRMMKISDLTAAVPQSNQSTLNRFILSGCDSRAVASFPCMASSIRQVASQFNNGESKGRYPTHPSEFYDDPTQGPAEQRTTWRPAIARYDMAAFCDDLEDFKADALFNEIFDYQYGYLTPKLHKEADCLAWLEDNIHKIYLNVERVHIDDCQHTAIQVLNASLALGQYDTWVRQRTQAGIANLKSAVRVVLKAQYEAVAAVAIREAQANPGQRIPVVFTLVGGSAFGNDPEDIAGAFKAAMTLLENAGLDNIDVCLSIYGSYELAIYESLLPDFFAQASELTQDQLRAQRHLPAPTSKLATAKSAATSTHASTSKRETENPISTAAPVPATTSKREAKKPISTAAPAPATTSRRETEKPISTAAPAPATTSKLATAKSAATSTHESTSKRSTSNPTSTAAPQSESQIDAAFFMKCCIASSVLCCGALLFAAACPLLSLSATVAYSAASVGVLAGGAALYCLFKSRATSDTSSSGMAVNTQHSNRSPT